jgi:hypothetical protein
MLRNWLILVNDEDLAALIEENSSYTAFKTLKEIRVSLLSGKHTGVVVLSVLSTDKDSFSGFISGLRNHPSLSNVQVIIIDSLKSLFSEDEGIGIKFCTQDQISKLIDCPLVKSERKDNLEADNLPPISFKEEEPYPDNIELLKHLSAKTIAEMIEEKVISKSRQEVLEIFLLKIKENQLNSSL